MTEASDERESNQAGRRATRWTRLRRGFELDVRSLAAYRVALGTLIVYDVAARLPAYAAAYSDAGFLPRALVDAPAPWFSLFFASGRPVWALLCLGLVGLAGLALLVGFRTRIATVACLLLLTSLHFRNQLLLDAGDDWLRVQLIWCCLLPLGARLSWDARRGAAESGRSQRLLSLATVGFVLQFVVFYYVAGATKTGPDWHGEGNAIQSVLRNTYWARPLADVMLQSPALLAFTSRVVPVFEMLVPFLLISPVATARLRALGILLLLGFQVSLGSAIQLNLFPFINVAATLPFVPSAAWDWLEARRRSRRGEEDPPSVGPEETDVDSRLGITIPAAALIVLMVLLLPAPKMPTQELLAPGSRRHTGFHQTWSMYGPSAPQVDILPDLYGLDGKARVNLQHGELGPAWAELQKVLNEYRYRYLLERLVQYGPSVDDLRRRHLAWLCAEWKRRRGTPLDGVAFSTRFRVIDQPELQPIREHQIMALRCD